MIKKDGFKKVLVIRDEHILLTGIESLLNHETDLAVLSATPFDWNALRKEVEQFHPDVIVVDEGMHFGNNSHLLNLLDEYPSLRVILVNNSNNLLHIYDKQAITVLNSTDLLTAIRK